MPVDHITIKEAEMGDSAGVKVSQQMQTRIYFDPGGRWSHS
jgi:hypothetical protein